VHKILVDGCELVLELGLEMGDDLGVAFHADSLEAPPGGCKLAILA
jgi:hypothetical protein